MVKGKVGLDPLEKFSTLYKAALEQLKGSQDYLKFA